MGVFADLAAGLVGGALDKIAPEVGGYFREKQHQKHLIEMERLKGKQAWEMAQTRRAEKSEGRDHEWEMQSLVLHGKGWKDEFVLLVLSVPAIMAFIPTLDQYVLDGFKALGTTPYWYQVLLASIYFAIYGIRAVRRDNAKVDLLKSMGETKDG